MKVNNQKSVKHLTRFIANLWQIHPFGLLLSEHNELKNRYVHIRYDEYVKSLTENSRVKDTAKSYESHSKITINLTQLQQKIFEAVKENKYVSQTELAAILSMTRETINRNMKKLQKQNIIRRIGADKNGHWEIVEE